MYAIHPELTYAIVEGRQRQLRHTAERWHRKPIHARHRVRHRH